MSKYTKILFGAIVLTALIVVLSITTPWHRSPMVFYAPLLTPMEVIKGDVVQLQDGTTMVIDKNMTINSIDVGDGVLKIEVIKHYNLWEIMSGESEKPSVSYYPAGIIKSY